MNGIPVRTLGQRRQVVFKVAQIDVATVDVDLLIVGMSEQDVAGQATAVEAAGGEATPGKAAAGRVGARQLDAVLHGTLGRLRAGGIFGGGFGETLVLTPLPPPLRVGALLLIGMGPAARVDPDSFARLTWLAMRSALRRRAGRAACLLGWSELDIPSPAIAPTAAGMMRGALQAIDDRADAGNGASDMPALEWIFDIRNGEAERTADALAAALADWR